MVNTSNSTNKIIQRIQKVVTFFAIAMLYCAYQFFFQETTMAMIGYAAASILSAITMTTIYVIFYVFLNRHITIREIKRLELQIALLVNKIESQGHNNA